MQLHRGTRKALFKNSQCIWGRTLQINCKPVFLKPDLCQQGHPCTAWSRAAAIITDLLCLVELKLSVPSAHDSLLMPQSSLVCFPGPGEVLLPLSSPAYHYTLSRGKAVFVAGFCYLCRHKWKHSSTGIATAFLITSSPQGSLGLLSSAQAATLFTADTQAGNTPTSWFQSAYPERGILRMQGLLWVVFLCSSSSSWSINLVCFLHTVAEKNLCPCCCFCSVYHFERHGPFH